MGSCLCYFHLLLRTLHGCFHRVIEFGLLFHWAPDFFLKWLASTPIAIHCLTCLHKLNQERLPKLFFFSFDFSFLFINQISKHDVLLYIFKVFQIKAIVLVIITWYFTTTIIASSYWHLRLWLACCSIHGSSFSLPRCVSCSTKSCKVILLFCWTTWCGICKTPLWRA